MGIVALVLWMLPPDAGPVAGQESGDESEEEDGKKKEAPPDCNDPGNIGHPMCWTATPTPRPTATPRPPTPTPDPCYNPWHCVPTATPTPTPTDTPTPVPSGSLGASPATIYVASSTTLTASNVSPSGLAVKIEYPSPAMTTGSCTGSGGKGSITSKSYVDVPSDLSGVSMRGCSTGTHQLRLLTKTGNVELAKVSVSVVNRAAPDPDPDPPKPVPTLTASLRATTTDITRGNSTEVEVHSVSPSNAALRIQHSSWLKRGSACATQQAEPAAVTIEYSFNGRRTFTFTGCGVGTHTVKLLPKVGSTVLGTVSIKVDAKTTPPTPTPLTFGTSTIPDQFYHVNERVDFKMPTATGGSGTIRYTVTPSIKGRVGYNDYTHKIEGVPVNPTETVEHTFTATDEKGKTAKLKFKVAVFKVELRVGDLGLDETRWGVFEHDTTTVRTSEKRAGGKKSESGYQFSVMIPASTGFQLNSNACTWPSAPPTSSVKLWSDWTYANATFDIVRCGIGAGGSAKVEVRVRLENSGTSSLLYAKHVTIPQSKHQHDHKITFHVRGTYTYIGSNGKTQWAIKGTGANGTGMFPLYPASGPPSTSTKPNLDLLIHAAYTDAAEDWNAIIGNVEIATTTAAKAEMSIVGYWAPEVGGKEDKCKNSIACADETGMWLEEPPYWPDQKKEWVNNYALWNTNKGALQYLPAILVHEFGHPLGLANTKSMKSIMSGNALELPCDADILKCLTINDLTGLHMIYLRHVAHE